MHALIDWVVRQETELFQSIWSQEKFLQGFEDASTVHLYKRKANRHACDNHHGIWLLSIAGKILARILLNRLTHHLEQSVTREPLWVQARPVSYTHLTLPTTILV